MEASWKWDSDTDGCLAPWKLYFWYFSLFGLRKNSQCWTTCLQFQKNNVKPTSNENRNPWTLQKLIAFIIFSTRLESSDFNQWIYSVLTHPPNKTQDRNLKWGEYSWFLMVFPREACPIATHHYYQVSPFGKLAWQRCYWKIEQVWGNSVGLVKLNAFHFASPDRT